MKNVRHQVRGQVWDQVWGQVLVQVGVQVGGQVWNQVGGQVWVQVGGQVWNQIWVQVEDQVRADLKKMKPIHLKSEIGPAIINNMLCSPSVISKMWEIRKVVDRSKRVVKVRIYREIYSTILVGMW